MNKDAVQHERGPRKPKLHLQLNHNSTSHHHHNQQAQHHHQQSQSQHVPGSNAHPGHNQMSHGGLPPLPPLHPHAMITGHHKMDHQFGKLHLQGFNSLAPTAAHPLHSFQFPPAFFGHHSSPIMKPVPAPGSSSASSSGSLPGPPAGVSGGPDSVTPPGDQDLIQSPVPAGFQQPHTPAHPGMLHILMSAERCQELVWSAKQLQIQGDVMMSPPIPSPLALPLTPTWEVLQETTARLLFMAVRWVRCLAPFQTLSKRDQLLLLQESWKELFLLHLAQWSAPWDLGALLERQRTNVGLDAEEANAVQEILCRFRQIAPDGSECGCMKAVVLFAPETAGLCDVQPVEMLQDQAQCILGDYVRSRYPRQPTRFGRLLLLLPCLRAVRPVTVELLFFKETIGEIPISRLLGDMYQMEKPSN